MKTKSFIRLITLIMFFGAVALRAQDQPSPGEQAVQAQAAAQASQAEAEKQTTEANEQYEKAQEHFQKLLAEQAPQALPGGGHFQQRLQAIVPGPGRRGTKGLVIRSSESDDALQANLEEDLAVMSHILTKSVEEKIGGSGQPDNVLGINLAFGSGQGAFRSFYLEGYGALFMLNVNFPLLPPPAGEAQKEKTETDSTWETAREELYGGPRAEAGGGTASTEPYDTEKVNRLKTTLLESLKNATNIRGLKPEDVVTICVTGGAGSGRAWTRTRVFGSGGGGGGGLFEARGGGARQSILTLRVKKSDIDAFAKGKMTFEAFEKRAQIATYAANADGSTGTPFGGGGFGGFGGGGGFGGAGGSTR